MGGCIRMIRCRPAGSTGESTPRDDETKSGSIFRAHDFPNYQFYENLSICGFLVALNFTARDLTH
jgi:hypothetical protein